MTDMRRLSRALWELPLFVACFFFRFSGQAGNVHKSLAENDGCGRELSRESASRLAGTACQQGMVESDLTDREEEDDRARIRLGRWRGVYTRFVHLTPACLTSEVQVA